MVEYVRGRSRSGSRFDPNGQEADSSLVGGQPGVDVICSESGSVDELGSVFKFLLREIES